LKELRGRRGSRFRIAEEKFIMKPDEKGFMMLDKKPNKV